MQCALMNYSVKLLVSWKSSPIFLPCWSLPRKHSSISLNPENFGTIYVKSTQPAPSPKRLLPSISMESSNLETALLTAQEPLAISEVRKLFEGEVSSKALHALLEELREKWRDSGIELVNVAVGRVFTTNRACFPSTSRGSARSPFSPATIRRSWSPSPTTSRTRWSAPGISSTRRIVPTLTSTFSKSATEITGFTGAGTRPPLARPATLPTGRDLPAGRCYVRRAHEQ